MSDAICIVMGALDVVAGILLFTTGITIIMVIGGIMLGKGIVSFF